MIARYRFFVETLVALIILAENACPPSSSGHWPAVIVSNNKREAAMFSTELWLGLVLLLIVKTGIKKSKFVLVGSSTCCSKLSEDSVFFVLVDCFWLALQLNYIIWKYVKSWAQEPCWWRWGGLRGRCGYTMFDNVQTTFDLCVISLMDVWWTWDGRLMDVWLVFY